MATGSLRNVNVMSRKQIVSLYIYKCYFYENITFLFLFSDFTTIIIIIIYMFLKKLLLLFLQAAPVKS